MDSFFVIQGQKKLAGTIEVKGAKNFALKALAAALLTDETSTITNVPNIVDVQVMIELLTKMGLTITQEGTTITIQNKDHGPIQLDPGDAQRIRASIVLIGPLLARQKEVAIPHPGGDIIGKRPIDFFLTGLEKMGASIKADAEFYHLAAPRGLKGTTIFLPKISVTSTETLIMAATLAQGTTVIKNAAQEPEVVALCEDLVKMGAKIQGIGTSTIVIEGVSSLKGGQFTTIPDRIETGTFVMMGIMNNAELTVTNCNPAHAEALWDVLIRAGAQIEIGPDWIKTHKSKKPLEAISIQSHEYPGFATDLQPIYTLLMTQAQGTCIIHEPIFEGRLFFTDILNRMGANIIMCDPHRVVVTGPTPLMGKKIESPDIRAGITLLLAGIIAKGETVIANAQVIDRGYEQIENRLKKLGVDIIRQEHVY